MSRKRRSLSPEDEEIWGKVARTAIPLHRRPAAALAEKPAQSPPDWPDPVVPDTAFLGPPAPKPATRIMLQPSIEEAIAAHPLRMDHRAFRKMKRGKSEPEARIDLHGMTLSAAHPALIGFILRAQAAGNRLVLVITGKGRPSDDAGPIPQRVGALRHQVPHWLHAPPLHQAVQQIAPAHHRHGGSGAYYVYLRRSRRD